MKKRDDYRFVILDRNGELQNQFYSPTEDISFNPDGFDSVDWSHDRESTTPETIAALIPESGGNSFLSTLARSLLADVFSVANNSVEVNSLFNKIPLDKLQTVLTGKSSSRFHSYFGCDS